MGTGAPKGVIPLLERFFRVSGDPFIEALARIEGVVNCLCLDAHYKFLRTRDPYARGRADACTDILEYIAVAKEAHTR